MSETTADRLVICDEAYPEVAVVRLVLDNPCLRRGRL